MDAELTTTIGQLSINNGKWRNDPPNQVAVREPKSEDAPGAGKGDLFIITEIQGNAAAHRMAQQVMRPVARRLREIGGEVGIGMAVAPRAVAVIAHVDGHDLAIRREPLGDHAPVARRRAVADRVQHGARLPPPRSEGQPAGQCAPRIARGGRGG